MAKLEVSLGSISHGTLKTQDLWDTFLFEAKYRKLIDDNHELQKVSAALSLIDDEPTWEAFYASDFATEAVNETLHDLLSENLPDFIYFGTHPGDGSDFGYWFDSESFERACADGECLKVEELPETWPSDDVHHVAVISDHGNIELYYRGEDGGFVHMYGVV